jgi:hypothetical protein
MSHDDDNKGDPRRGRGARGRWQKGHCPNPKGRPKKQPKVYRDQSDLHFFGTTMVEVMVNGEIEMMDRREALINKIYESAMKGKVTNQRWLFREFEKNDESLGETLARYYEMMHHWIIDNPDLGKRDFVMPHSVELQLLKYRKVLNHYFPGSYPPNGWAESEDGDDDDE